MACIELPKDAKGRKIPLDTVVLFSRSGEAHNIVRWIYTTDFETWTESNMWRAIAENHRALDPELMYLTPPDSWERLEEDLRRASERNVVTSYCRYFNTTNRCVNCPIHNDDGCCTDKDERAFGDILDRIRKLRGED